MPLAITPTFRPWTHTSDDSYIYQLSLAVATATVSLSLLPHAVVHDHFFIYSSKYFVVIHSWPAAVRDVLNMSAKGLPSCHSLYTILSDPVSGYVSTYPRYYSSLSCHAVLSIRIATESLNINYTCWYTLSLIPLLLSFWWSASNTTKTGG